MTFDEWMESEEGKHAKNLAEANCLKLSFATAFYAGYDAGISKAMTIVARVQKAEKETSTQL